MRWPPLSDNLLLAERVVKATYGDSVSVWAKGKFLNKFGRNRTVGTTFETIAELQGTTSAPPYGTTNAQNSVVCDNAGETKTWVYEGHSVDGTGNLTFVSDEVTLSGQTRVALPVAVRDVTRAYVKPSGTFGTTPTGAAGNLYFYDNTDGETAGVPNTPADTSLVIITGETQSEKAATSISQNDYWFLSYFGAGIGESGASANIVTVRMEIRDVVNGGGWRPLGADIPIVIGQQNPPLIKFGPFPIVPPSHDWRVQAKTDTNTAEVSAEAGGYLARVI